MSKSLTQMCADVVAEKDRQISDLQSQLAEKKKEINDYKQRFNSCEERCKTFLTNGAKALKLKNQDKISFCIEQLEKVKKVVKHFCELHSDEFYGVKSQVMGIREDVFEFIDQQIEELKKGVE